VDKLSAMKTFVRVVESGSFSAVAKETGATQSAVSKQVAALERELGAKLLARTTRALSLTEEGGRYFENARRLVADVEEAESDLCRGASQISGWVRIAAPVGFGRLRLMPLVKEFIENHPQVKVDLRLHDGFVDLVEQGIDVAVRIGALSDSGLVARRVGTSFRLLVAHRDYLRGLRLGRKTPRSPEDLREHNCLVYTELPSRNLWTFTAGRGAQERAGTARAVRVEGNLQTNSSEALRAAVLLGMGIGYLPDWLFAEELKTGEVQRVMPEWDAPKAPIHLLSPLQRRHSAKVKAFGDFVTGRL
jgi:DNA-binding transcriptional LysR family regulator